MRLLKDRNRGDLSGLGPDERTPRCHDDPGAKTTATLALAIRIVNPGHETSFSPRSIELDELLGSTRILPLFRSFGNGIRT